MLVGIHDCAQAEEEALLNENANRDAAAGRETSESEECESGEKYVPFWVFQVFKKNKSNHWIAFFVRFGLDAHIIRLPIHLEAWASITTLFKTLTFMHCIVLKVSVLQFKQRMTHSQCTGKMEKFSISQKSLLSLLLDNLSNFDGKQTLFCH